MLTGSRPVYAPETDEGAEVDDDHVEDDAPEDDEIEDEDDTEVDEDADEDAEPDEDEPVRKPTRGENRVAAATRTAAEAKARAETLERELAQERASKNQTSQADAARQRTELLANMSAEERLEYLIKEQGQTTAQRLAQIEFASWDANDKAAFAGKVASTPALKGLEAEVERVLGELRGIGQNNTRENIAAYVLGQKALAKMTRSNNAGAKKSAASKERQNGRPANGRGDVAADRSRGDQNSLSALEKRLMGRKI